MAQTLNKEKISIVLKDKFGLPSVICEKIVSLFFEEIVRISFAEKKLTLRDFGKFYINHKKARPGFNIIKGEAVTIKERTVLCFAASKSLKEKL